MFFAERYAKELELSARPHRHPDYHQHILVLHRSKPQMHQVWLRWLGQRMERWGRSLQNRYGNAPQLAQQ